MVVSRVFTIIVYRFSKIYSAFILEFFFGVKKNLYLPAILQNRAKFLGNRNTNPTKRRFVWGKGFFSMRKLHCSQARACGADLPKAAWGGRGRFLSIKGT